MAAVAAASASLLAGCLEELPRPSLVDDVRVLAITNEPAEARPGDSVALTALVVDPLDRERVVTWATCIVPEQGFGFFGGSTETSSSGGNGYGLDDPGSCFTLANAGERWAHLLGTGETATLAVPSDLFDDDAALNTAYGVPEGTELPAELRALFLGIAGLNLTVSVRVEVGGRTLEATKRVNVGLPSLIPDNPANENPQAATYHFARKVDLETPPPTGTPPLDGTCFIGAGGDLTLVRQTRYVMTPVNIPDPQPTYVVLLSGSTNREVPFEAVSQQENWYFSWFSTIEGLDKDVSKSSAAPVNSLLVPEDAPDAGDLWIVVRDGRGGTAWCATHFTVEDP